jgi:predicted transcriptional regulator
MVSRRLKEDYDMTQQQIAMKLGVTQASISNYSRKARGVMINLETDPNIAKATDDVAAMLATENPDQREALRLITEVCDYIRVNHLLCALHSDLEPDFHVEGCYACDGGLLVKEALKLKAAPG